MSFFPWITKQISLEDQQKRDDLKMRLVEARTKRRQFYHRMTDAMADAARFDLMHNSWSALEDELLDEMEKLK